jgi:hypothetical protein
MSLPIETALKQLIDPPPPPPASNGFLDAMRTEPAPAHNFTLTENGALAHASTESALVDLFFDFAPNVDPTDLYRLLEKAWKEDSLSYVHFLNTLPFPPFSFLSWALATLPNHDESLIG